MTTSDKNIYGNCTMIIQLHFLIKDNTSLISNLHFDVHDPCDSFLFTKLPYGGTTVKKIIVIGLFWDINPT